MYFYAVRFNYLKLYFHLERKFKISMAQEVRFVVLVQSSVNLDIIKS